MNSYLESQIKSSYITNILDILNYEITRNQNNPLSNDKVFDIIDSYQKTFESLTGITDHDIQTKHLLSRKTNIEEIVKFITNEKPAYTPEIKKKLLDFTTPFLLKDNHINYFILLHDTAAHIQILESIRTKKPLDTIKTALVLLKDIGLAANANKTTIKEIIDGSKLSAWSRTIFSDLDDDLEFNNPIQYYKNYIRYRTFLNNNIEKTTEGLITIGENNLPEERRAIRDSAHMIFTDIMDNYSFGKLNLETVQKAIDLFREEINHHQREYNDIRELDRADPLFAIRRFVNSRSPVYRNSVTYEDHCNLLDKGVPLSREQIDDLFNIIDENNIKHIDTLLAGVKYTDQDYFKKKIIERHQKEAEPNQFSTTLNINSRLSSLATKFIGKKIDILKEHNKDLFINIIDPEYIEQLTAADKNINYKYYTIHNILSIIESSSYLKSNLSKSFNWVNKEVLEDTSFTYGSQKKDYYILQAVMKSKSFKRWLLEDEQLKKEGITNQAIAGRRLSVRMLERPIDIENTVNIIIEKDDNSFNNHYLKNTSFRTVLEKAIEKHLANSEKTANNDTTTLSRLEQAKIKLENKALQVAVKSEKTSRRRVKI